MKIAIAISIFATMKYLTFIMAFLILGLSCLPCADNAYTMNAGKAKSEMIKKASTENETDHNDDCSPFCNCTCCAGFSINHSIASISSIVVFSSNRFSSYLPANISEVSFPVWQPPKIS